MDNGIGMSMLFKDKIFEPFFRIHQNNIRNVNGHGIGLTNVSSIVKMLNGKIEVKSKLGKGSEFKIIIPLK